MGLVSDLQMVHQRGVRINRYWPGDRVVIVRNITSTLTDWMIGETAVVMRVVPHSTMRLDYWEAHPEERWAYYVLLDEGQDGCHQVSWCFESELGLVE